MKREISKLFKQEVNEKKFNKIKISLYLNVLTNYE